jgi:hypothetical protein
MFGGWRIRAYWYVDGLAVIDTEFTDAIFVYCAQKLIIESKGKIHLRKGHEGPEGE